MIEHFAPHATKWTGILEAAKRMNIPPTAIAAIGDDTNDISMLQNAAISFAMGNASPEIRRHAKHTTAPQSEAGVAQAIENLLR